MVPFLENDSSPTTTLRQFQNAYGKGPDWIPIWYTAVFRIDDDTPVDVAGYLSKPWSGGFGLEYVNLSILVWRIDIDFCNPTAPNNSSICAMLATNDLS